MAQQERWFFLEDRDELWLTVKQRLAEISHSIPPRFLWMSETWSFAGPDIHLQFAGAEAQLKRDILTEALQTDCQAECFMDGNGWIERFIGTNPKHPEAMWLRQNVPVTPVTVVESADHVWCRNIAVLSRSGQYEPCEWWLAKKMQNSQCKRVVSVSLLEGAILGLWQASLSQHGVWVFKFFRGSSETQKHRMLIPNLHTRKKEQQSCCKCLLQKPSRCLIWMNWYQWNRSFSGKLCLLSKCEHLKSGRRFHSKVSFRYSVRLAFRKDFNKPVRRTKCIFWVNMKGVWLFFRGWLSKTHH